MSSVLYVDTYPISCAEIASCVLPPSSLPQSLHFTSSVRGRERRQLPIRNPTHSTWLLHPVISGEQWVGPDTLTIDPGRAGYYELTYQPMTMTSDSHKHQVGWGMVMGRRRDGGL